jgi:nucleoside-specific outer membrane channel protein Tsx
MSNLQHLEKIEEVFNIYLERIFFSSGLKKRFWEEIICKTDSYIFGGVIVDFLNRDSNHRDIDIVVECLTEDHLEELKKYQFQRNSFGGFKIKIDNLNIDLWLLKKTWAITRNNYLNFDLYKLLPSTSFFSSTAIIYSIREKKLYYKDSFIQFIENKKIDIIFEDNPYPELCIVKSYQYYLQKYKFSTQLVDYIVKNFPRRQSSLEQIQIKHYGFIKYSIEDLCEFYNKIKTNRRTENQINSNNKILSNKEQLQLF